MYTLRSNLYSNKIKQHNVHVQQLKEMPFTLVESVYDWATLLW